LPVYVLSSLRSVQPQFSSKVKKINVKISFFTFPLGVEEVSGGAEVVIGLYVRNCLLTVGTVEEELPLPGQLKSTLVQLEIASDV
jgi:hypothetical protein